jgi:nucleotide-binding universal stress UspA family protein
VSVAAEPDRGTRRASFRRRSTPSSLAPRGVIELAGDDSLDVTVLHVLDEASLPAFTDQPQHETKAWAREFLQRYCSTDVGRVQFEMRVGRPEELVPQAAHETGVDLIALGWSRALAPGRPCRARSARARPCARSTFPSRRESEGGVIRKAAIVARLTSGPEQEAADLLSNGPPFDSGEKGLQTHAVYLSAGEVVFVFEGPEVDVVLDDLVENQFEAFVAAALESWRPLIEGIPRIAQPAYEWHREAR